MKNIYLGFKFVISYFSILPVSFKKDDDLSHPAVLKYTLFFLPFLGLVLGTLSITLYELLSPSLYSAFLCSIFYMFLYGFIHTEAISDVIDAIYAAHSGKDPYEIIKEPHIGAMGMLYSVALVLLKVVSLTYILYEELFLEFLSIVILSRFFVLYMVSFNEFRSSFVNLLKNSFSKNTFFLSIIFYALICYLLLGINIVYFIFGMFFLTLLISSYLKKRLGFLNGDALGFNIEITEIFTMIVLLTYLNS